MHQFLHGQEVCLRGKLDGNDELIKFSNNVEEVCIKTVESGSMTKDLAILINKTTRYLTTNQFLEAIDKNLKSLINFLQILL